MAETFGELLRRYRRAAGLSQGSLAESARLSVETIGALERGTRRAPYGETVDSLGAALGLSEPELRTFRSVAERKRARNANIAGKDDALRRLPFFSTSFVGRAAEIADIRGLQASHRLLTVTGTGGIGKTRTACEAIRVILVERRMPVWFADVGALEDGAFVANKIAGACGLPGDHTRAETISAALASQRGLLVCDNCEHLIGTVAPIVEALLEGCPNVSILTTSRQPLQIAGEAVYRLNSLQLPDDGIDSDRLHDYAAIELFIARALTVEPRLVLDERAMQTVAAICRRLAGVPLALELAAARVRMLGLTDLLARIGQRFVLAGGARDVPLRQQTMHATISWSYDLLGEQEKTVLRRLAILAGRFRLEVAQAVCGDEHIDGETVGELVSALIDKSLLTVHSDGETTRYALLDLVRAFALERLSAGGEANSVRRRYLAWLAEYAERSEFRMLSKKLVEGRQEIENMRVVLEWAFQSEHIDDAVLAGRAVGCLYALWFDAGLVSEFRRWAETALSRLDEDVHEVVIEALMPGLVMSTRGRAAIDTVERAIRIFERGGNPRRTAFGYTRYSVELHRCGRYGEAQIAGRHALDILRGAKLDRTATFVLASIAHAAMESFCGDSARARPHMDEALDVMRELNDESYMFTFAANRAIIEANDRNYSLATALCEEIIERERKQSSPDLNLAVALSNLACFRLELGDVSGAESAAREAGSVMRDPGHPTWFSAIQALAAVLALRRRPVVAARLAGFVDAWFAREGYCRDTIDQRCYDRLSTSLGEQLSEEERAKLGALGGLLSPEAAKHEALAAFEAQFVD